MDQNQQVSRILPVVQRYLAEEKVKFPIEQAWLFGSWVYGTPGPDSDIDLSLVIDKPEVDDEIQLYRDALRIDNRIETHVFSKDQFARGQLFILHDIKTKGIRIL